MKSTGVHARIKREIGEILKFTTEFGLPESVTTQRSEFATLYAVAEDNDQVNELVLDLVERLKGEIDFRTGEFLRFVLSRPSLLNPDLSRA